MPAMPRSVAFAATCSLVLFAAGAKADPLTLVDPTGRPVDLAGPAERIVMIPIPSSSTVIALDGSAGRLVGMHPLAKAAIEDGILGVFFPDARSVTSDILNSGGSEEFSPNVEAIAALRPDLVVQWGNRGEDITQPLVNAGFDVGLILYGDEQKARDIMAFLGDAIGRKEKLAEIMAWRDATAAAIKTKTDALADDQKPKVLYLLRAIGELRANGTGTYNDYYIKLAGGRNAAAEIQDIKQINREQVAAWDPDVILLNGFEANLDLSAVYDDPILAGTAAAREKRVYKMPIGGYRWDPPSHESPFTWMWLADVLHPELFDFDIRGEIKTWYARLYGQVPTEDQIDGILRLAMNGDSAGYDRFRRD